MMQPALSQVCSLAAPFETDIAGYAASGCRTIEIWLGKLDVYLETHTVDDVRRLFEKHDVTAPVASYQGGLFEENADARRHHWEHFRRRLAICRDLGIQTLVVAADLPVPLTGEKLDLAFETRKDASRAAAESGVRLAIEFQAKSALLNNLQSALKFVDVGDPSLGVCLDMFHFWNGPSQSEDFEWISTENLFHVQLCDLSGTLRELAADSDRILPGDGDLPVAAVVGHLRRIGYRGTVSIELMNPEIWNIPPRQFGEIALVALRKVLGQAEM